MPMHVAQALVLLLLAADSVKVPTDPGLYYLNPKGVTRLEGRAVTVAHSGSKLPPIPLKGGDPATNAELLRRVLEGKPGDHRDLVLANASAALVAAGKAEGFVQGVEIAAQAIDSGTARRTLAALVEFTQKNRL